MILMEREAETVNRETVRETRLTTNEAREFLSQLRKDDIEAWKGAIRLYQTVQTLGRVGKWAAISILALLLGIVSFYENVVKILGWLWPPK